jgi:hypothetical protein
MNVWVLLDLVATSFCFNVVLYSLVQAAVFTERKDPYLLFYTAIT